MYIRCDAHGPIHMQVVFSTRCPPTARGQECASAVSRLDVPASRDQRHVCETLSENKRAVAIADTHRSCNWYQYRFLQSRRLRTFPEFVRFRTCSTEKRASRVLFTISAL